MNTCVHNLGLVPVFTREDVHQVAAGNCVIDNIRFAQHVWAKRQMFPNLVAYSWERPCQKILDKREAKQLQAPTMKYAKT